MRNTMEKMDRVVDSIKGVPVYYDYVNYYIKIDNQNITINYQKKR